MKACYSSEGQTMPSRRLAWIVLLLGPFLIVTRSPLPAAEDLRKPEEPPASQPQKPGSAFTPGSSPSSFDFATDRIQGTLRVDGAYHGITRLRDKRTGRQVIDDRYSALNLFKLMSVNQVMGQPRAMDRTGRLGADGVEVRWPPAEGHRAEIIARYQLAPPAAIDLTVTVRAQGSYPGYELFLSSYFDRSLRPHVWLTPRGNQPPEHVLPTVNDVFRGTVLVFPRDSLAARLCLDGRWERNECNTPVVQMCPVRHYAYCLAVLADPENRLGVAIMSDPRCCYALSTRYHADAEADRLTSYSAFDLSLFGSDVRPGDELRAKVRLAIVDLEGDMSRAVELCQSYLAQTRQDRSSSPGPSAKGGSP